MSRLYLSFLGTTDYYPCTYYLGKLDFVGVRFVQEATVQAACSKWLKEDRILIFTTHEAYDKNWSDNGHLKNGIIQKREGLFGRLNKLKLNPKHKNIFIPEGKKESEIWEIFQIVFDQIEQNDEVVLDITHGFRSIPMLAMVVLNYAKVLNNISINAIYYGALEALGKMEEVKNMPADNKRVPIFELTNFDVLLDWSLAIDRFLGAGDARPACNLTTREITPLLTTSKGRHEAASLIKRLTISLEKFTKVLTTCRGLELSTTASDLKNALRQCEEIDLIKPLKPLLIKIREQVQHFTSDEVHDGIQAVKWCFKHNLIQQGYTILREILLTHFNVETGQNSRDKNNREIAGQALAIHQGDIAEKEWKEPASEYKETTKKFLNYFSKHPELINTYNCIAALRNDLNHAGYKDNPVDSYKFERRLKKFIEQVEDSLR